MMKNSLKPVLFIPIASLCVVTSILCVGCGQKASSSTSNKRVTSVSATAAEKSDKPISLSTGRASSTVMDSEDPNREYAMELDTDSDYNKLAMNLSQLVSDSDLIVKIKVKAVKSFVNDNGMIQTEVTPEVLKTLKGNYDGQKMYVNGGEMLYSEYTANEIIQKSLAGHEDPSGNAAQKYVKQTVDNQYILTPGEEYIFFAQKRADSGLYFSTYAYQGTFKLTNGKVENQAITKDSLLTDIEKSMNGSGKVLKAANPGSGTPSFEESGFEKLLVSYQ
ncbi:MAG: hypothetical protein PUF78_04950 [Lachnospiraceae bacterium]|nr:hypothetical protein [Lachnospiraceae bacterium]